MILLLEGLRALICTKDNTLKQQCLTTCANVWFVWVLTLSSRMSLQIRFRACDRTHECSPLLYLLASAQQRSQAWSGLAEFQAWRLAEAVSVCFLGAAVRTESRAQACGETNREIFGELLLMYHLNPASTATSQRARGFRDNTPFQLHLDFYIWSA